MIAFCRRCLIQQDARDPNPYSRVLRAAGWRRRRKQHIAAAYPRYPASVGHEAHRCGQASNQHSAA